MLELYPYQRTLVTDASNLFRTHRSVLLQLATGGGKTVVAADISLQLARDNETCLYLVHRQELLSQTWNTLHKFGLGDQVGIIAAGHPETPWAPLQIASVPTLAKRLDRLTWLKPRMLFVDEAHHIRASTWELILGSFPDAFRLGLTATPARLDGRGLKPHFEILLEGPTINWLIANEYLADMDVFTVPGGLERAMLNASNGKFSDKQMDALADGPVIAAAIKNILKYAADRRSIFYAVSIRHSKELVAECNFHGIPAEHVDGNTPTAQREASMRRFSEGTTQLLSNVGLFSEGIDVPDCDCVIHGRPTKSLVYYRQANGRAMRRKSNGRKGRVLDLVDNVVEHGLPTEEIEWSLESGVEEKPKRKAARYVRICAECNYDYPGRLSACPLCGHEHVVRTVNEVEVELEQARAAKRDEKKRRGEMSRELNRKVYATLGDESKLRELQIEYGKPANIIFVWKRVYQPMWDRENRRRGEHGHTKRYA